MMYCKDCDCPKQSQHPAARTKVDLRSSSSRLGIVALAPSALACSVGLVRPRSRGMFLITIATPEAAEVIAIRPGRRR